MEFAKNTKINALANNHTKIFLTEAILEIISKQRIIQQN